MTVAVSDWSYVAAAALVPLFGFLGLWLDGRRRDRRIAELHDEVKSPNGSRAGDLTYETAKRVVELREQMVEIREAQVIGWQRAAADVARADEDRARLEEKVDQIAETQEEHVGRDESRFDALFRAVGADDPTAT